MKVCETCRFWHYAGAMDHDDGTKRGLCRRYPPNIGDAGRFRTYMQGWKYLCEDSCATWPMTDLDDWCGEYAAHEPAHVTADKDKEIERLREAMRFAVDIITDSWGEDQMESGDCQAVNVLRAALDGEKADG